MSKKYFIFTIFMLTLSKFSYAGEGLTAFTEIKQAELYCPPNNALTFTQKNNNIPNGKGSITGIKHVLFESLPPETSLKPLNLDENNWITDAKFRSANGIYGYFSNNKVTCFYSYIGFNKSNIYLVLRQN